MTEQDARDFRAISKCWQNSGWHVYGAGPCFDEYEEAIAYRDMLDAHGIKWKSQDAPWPIPKPIRAVPANTNTEEPA